MQFYKDYVTRCSFAKLITITNLMKIHEHKFNYIEIVGKTAGLENSTRPLVFTSASGCRASENFDFSSENQKISHICQ